MRVLVIEDDQEVARQVATILRQALYVVDVAHDGREGQFLGDTEPYDAVVLDLGLPRRDGLSVLQYWRQSGRNMPVLILTARDTWREKVAGLRGGEPHWPSTRPVLLLAATVAILFLSVDSVGLQPTLKAQQVTEERISELEMKLGALRQQAMLLSYKTDEDTLAARYQSRDTLAAELAALDERLGDQLGALVEPAQAAELLSPSFHPWNQAKPAISYPCSGS